MNAVRCMLDDAKLGHEWWGEALRTATILYNAIPHRSNGDRSPHELWTGSPPRIGHLRAFGTRAHLHVASELRGKLDDRSQSAIYLGPAREDASHHRLLVVDSEKIVETRNVIFREKSALVTNWQRIDHLGRRTKPRRRAIACG